MATTPPSTVRVTIGQTNPKVTTLQYGSRTLKSASDLSLAAATDGGVIVYRASTNDFAVQSANTVISTLDNGLF
jgi:hypothetical protein